MEPGDVRKAEGEGADGPVMHVYGAVDKDRDPESSGAYVATRIMQVDHRPPECEPSPSETSDRRLEYLYEHEGGICAMCVSTNI